MFPTEHEILITVWGRNEIIRFTSTYIIFSLNSFYINFKLRETKKNNNQISSYVKSDRNYSILSNLKLFKYHEMAWRRVDITRTLTWIDNDCEIEGICTESYKSYRRGMSKVNNWIIAIRTSLFDLILNCAYLLKGNSHLKYLIGYLN